MTIPKKHIGRRKFDASGRPPVVKAGDVIMLGKHKLLCGDSSKQETIDRLLDGTEIGTFVYDPEWSDLVPLDYDCTHKLVFCGGLELPKCIDMFGVPTFIFNWSTGRVYPVAGHIRPWLASKYCLWYGTWKRYYNRFQWGKEKTVTGVSRGSRGVPYIAKPGIHPLADLFELKKNTTIFPGKWHRHEKPWPWIAMILANCTEGTVLDPFAGAGTAMVACEKVDRTCYMAELLPEVCERIIERYIVTFSRHDDTITLNGEPIRWYKTRNPVRLYTDRPKE
uniref:Putative methyltransferase n=1 Tax=viral metagenome TaxID=1070528 RepID=A0A6M3MC28_9ZZZZ